MSQTRQPPLPSHHPRASQITIAPGMAGYNSSCVLRVAVHHPFLDIVGYDIVYEAADLTTLVPGSPMAGNTQVTQVRVGRREGVFHWLICGARR